MNREEKKTALNQAISRNTDRLKETADNYKSVGKDILVIGGLLVLGYSVYKLFSSDEDEDEINIPDNENNDKQNSNGSIIGSSVKGIASSLILALAKDKITSYLDSLNKDEA